MSGDRPGRRSSSLPSLHGSRELPLTRDRPSASFERLRAYIGARATLTAGEIDFIQSLFAPRRLDNYLPTLTVRL